MNLFGSPNIERMAAERDHDGLYKCLQHRNKLVRLQAAQALAGMEDGAGWRFLMDTVRSGSDLDDRTIAAAMLGELGHPRAVPVLEEALVKARYEMAQGEFTTALREALEAISGPEAKEALRKAGYEQPAQAPVGEEEETEDGGDTGLADFDAQYVRPILPRTDQIRFLTAEQHLQNAVDLREAEQAERGLVENSLALWLLPNWAYARYIRGVLFEDLDREMEAILAYHAALDLDPAQQDAAQALDELKDQDTFAELDPAALLAQLNSRGWQRRRDAAAGLGELFRRQLFARRARNQAPDPGAVVDALIEQVEDEEREVRRAVIEALGLFGDHRAVLPLLALRESSWLMRFTILEALSRLSAVDGLITVLRNEMNRIQDRNPVFSSHKDPLLEVEFDLLMEAGALALEKTGDIEGLLAIAESNTWEDTQGEGEEARSEGFFQSEENEDLLNGLLEEEEEADEDLTSYVDEVALMALIALERLAAGNLPRLTGPQLERLSAVPDLTLIDPADPEAEPVTVYDFSAMRQSATEELSRRGKTG